MLIDLKLISDFLFDIKDSYVEFTLYLEGISYPDFDPNRNSPDESSKMNQIREEITNYIIITLVGCFVSVCKKHHASRDSSVSFSFTKSNQLKMKEMSSTFVQNVLLVLE